MSAKKEAQAAVAWLLENSQWNNGQTSEAVKRFRAINKFLALASIDGDEVEA
jgi:hypothetical protein